MKMISKTSEVTQFSQESLVTNQLFIRILRDHLHGRTTVLSADVDWETISKLARDHQVEGMVYAQLRSLLPDVTSLQKAYYLTIADNLRRSDTVRDIGARLTENGIPFFMVKGAVIKDYYPQPALRTMGDTDFVVRLEDRELVHEILIQNGFTDSNHQMDLAWHYEKYGQIFELHHRLVYDGDISYTELNDFFNNCWSYVQGGELDASFHFLFLLVHLRAHLMGYGVGFRQFLDVAVMAKNELALQWDWIKEQLVRLELYSFASVCARLIERWFDIIIPLPSQKLDTTFEEAATAHILVNGVFGFCDPRGIQSFVINAVRGNRMPRAAMLRRAFSTMFPSYVTLLGNQHYHFLDGRPYLMPVAWIYRLYRGAYMLARDKKVVHMLYVSRGDIEKRAQYLRMWGL